MSCASDGQFLGCLGPLLCAEPGEEEVGTTGLPWGLDLLEAGNCAAHTGGAPVHQGTPHNAA